MGIVVRPDALMREVARRGWTLSDLAQASGLSGPTITAAIAGRSISPVSLRLIVRALLATRVLERVDDLLADGIAAMASSPSPDQAATYPKLSATLGTPRDAQTT